ncbi:hypothetical protein U1Q18_044983 [Sarracenia purpurea var. burkii]
MARSIYQTIVRIPQPPLFPIKSPSSSSCATRLVAFRTHSSQSGNSSRVDPNLLDSDTDQREVLAVQKIGDAIHRIIVRRSAPDWLPFVPGSSYWVPPQRPSYGIAQLVVKLANTLTDDQVMSLTNSRGWPSSAFFLNGSVGSDEFA